MFVVNTISIFVWDPLKVFIFNRELFFIRSLTDTKRLYIQNILYMVDTIKGVIDHGKRTLLNFLFEWMAIPLLIGTMITLIVLAAIM